MLVRQKGIKYELQIINELKAEGWEAKSTRNNNRALDAEKVDIISDIPFHIQCKRVENLRNPEGILKSMPNDKCPVIFTKKNHKPDMVIMLKDDFYFMLKCLLFEQLENGYK